MTHRGGKAQGIFQRWWSRPAAAEPDPADYGTCIGMEYSLDAVPPPASPPVATAPQAGWLRRLRARPKTG